MLTLFFRHALPALLLVGTTTVLAAPPAEQHPNDDTPKAPYLMAGAPTFEISIADFRLKYNLANPMQQIDEFHAIQDTPGNTVLTRAASKINEDLFASTALEKGTGKIKTLQITYLPIQGPEAKAARTTAIAYMANLMRQFDPTLNVTQSVTKVTSSLDKGKGSQFYQQQVGAIRYVVSDNGEKGLTFAVEPVKLALSEP